MLDQHPLSAIQNPLDDAGMLCYVLHCVVLYCIKLYCIVLYCIVLFVEQGWWGDWKQFQKLKHFKTCDFDLRHFKSKMSILKLTGFLIEWLDKTHEIEFVTNHLQEILDLHIASKSRRQTPKMKSIEYILTSRPFHRDP